MDERGAERLMEAFAKGACPMLIYLTMNDAFRVHGYDTLLRETRRKSNLTISYVSY